MSYQMTELVRKFTTAPNGLVFHPSQKLVLILLATYYNDDEGYAFPGLSRLANEAGVHRNTILRILNDLEAAGCICRERQEGAWGSNFVSNHYVFLPDFLADESCRVILPGSRVRRPRVADAEDEHRDEEKQFLSVSESEVASPTMLRGNTHGAT